MVFENSHRHFFKQPTLAVSSMGLPYLDYTRGCEADAWAIYTCGAFNLAFLFLFMHWYLTTYMLVPPKSTSGLAAHEKTC